MLISFVGIKNSCTFALNLKNNKIMELKEIEDIKQGDIISVDHGKTKETYNHKCMRQSGRWEVYVFGKWGGIYLQPHTKVRFYGKCDDVAVWSDEEKAEYTLTMWNKARKKLPASVVEQLEPLNGGKLFGKRGQYQLIEKRPFIQDYKRVSKLVDAMKTHKGVIKALVRVADEIENIDYSREMESECYGYRNYYITITCGDLSEVSL